MNQTLPIRVHPRPKLQLVGPVEIAGETFPDQPSRGDGPPATLANVRHVLARNGIVVRYNIVKKRTEIAVPWLAGTAENADSVAMTHITSLALLYRMPTGHVAAMVEAISDEAAYNPAADWMRSQPWDGTDRLPAVYATVTARAEYPAALKAIILRKWLLSVAAAALLPDGFRCRGVLTLQGPQGIGKTSWGLNLINEPQLRNALIKVDHHLDPGNKDSQLGAIDHLIVEIGELDSSFKRDVARLKGFLTASTDKIRRPYGRVTSDYQRRTVFYATVNATDFLVDSTGNSRFWTIPVVQLDFDHNIDMQQVFAQLAVQLADGAEWWLTPEEDRLLEDQNARHRSTSVVHDQLLELIDVDAVDLTACKPQTATEVLRAAGFERPTNTQAKECAGLLREWFGEPKRINGRNVWRVSIRATPGFGDQHPTAHPEPSKSRFD